MDNTERDQMQEHVQDRAGKECETIQEELLGKTQNYGAGFGISHPNENINWWCMKKARWKLLVHFFNKCVERSI
jgi:hypothetical protein